MGYLAITLIGLGWLARDLLSIQGWFRLIVMITALAIPIKKYQKYARNQFQASDQDFYALLGGDVDRTISGHIGLKAIMGSKNHKQAEKVVNLVFWYQKDHCFRSIDWSEVSQEDKKLYTNSRKA